MYGKQAASYDQLFHQRIPRKRQAFEDKIGKGVSLERLVGPVKKALCGKLPGPAIYMMVFPFDRNLSVNRSNLKQHQENLKEWVRENAPLQQRHPDPARDTLTGNDRSFPQ